MNKVARYLMGAVLLVALIGPTLAQQPRVERLDIIEAGFFAYEPIGAPKESDQSVGGLVIRPKNMRFLSESKAVKAQIGTSFGARFRSVGAPPMRRSRFKRSGKFRRRDWPIPEMARPTANPDRLSPPELARTISAVTGSTNNGRLCRAPGRCKSGKATASYSNAISKFDEGGMNWSSL